MALKFYKYQGAGNDFLIADNRDGSIRLTEEQIAALENVRIQGLMTIAPYVVDAEENRLYFL